MGVKATMLLSSEGDTAAALRRAMDTVPEGSEDLVRLALPYRTGPLLPVGATSLKLGAYPPEGTTHAARFPGLDIVCDQALFDFGSSPFPELAEGPDRRLLSLSVHSVVDHFSFALWEEGRLVRSLSVSSESGVSEDIGDPLPFEAPYWEGRYPAIADDSYPLPFHPAGLAERTAEELLGFWYEGLPPSDGFDPGRVALEAFRSDG